MVLQRKDKHLQPQLMKKLHYLWHYTLKKVGNDLLKTFILFFNVHTGNLFASLYQSSSKPLFCYQGKKILYFALVYKFIRSLVIVTNSFIASLLIKQVARKVLFRHCSIEPYLVIANKDELKKNRCQESIISKIK